MDLHPSEQAVPIFLPALRTNLPFSPNSHFLPVTGTLRPIRLRRTTDRGACSLAKGLSTAGIMPQNHLACQCVIGSMFRLSKFPNETYPVASDELTPAQGGNLWVASREFSRTSDGTTNSSYSFIRPFQSLVTSYDAEEVSLYNRQRSIPQLAGCTIAETTVHGACCRRVRTSRPDRAQPLPVRCYNRDLQFVIWVKIMTEARSYDEQDR